MTASRHYWMNYSGLRPIFRQASCDELYRLTDYDRGQLVSGSISSPDLTQEWTPDQTGNWHNFVQGVTGTLNQTRTHNTTNEITNITQSVGAAWPIPTHDDNGNMTSFPQPNSLTNSYDATWDAWNRLVKLEDGSDTVAEFEHDGLGRRVIKKVYKSGSLTETRRFYYSTSSQVLEERVDSDTDPAQQFLWGIRFVDDLVLRDKDTTGNGTLNERLYGLSDPRFSLLAIADTSGTVQERYNYDGYGRCLVMAPNFKTRTTSSFDWEYRYTGRRLDLETAIYFFRARYYHAELGRFISRDPIGYVDGMNLYRAYMVPNSVDPYGLQDYDNKDVAACIGILSGVAGGAGLFRDYKCAQALLKKFLTGIGGGDGPYCPKECIDSLNNYDWAILFEDRISKAAICGLRGRIKGYGLSGPILFPKPSDLYWAFKWANFMTSEWACTYDCGQRDSRCCCDCNAECGVASLTITDKYDFCSSLPKPLPLNPVMDTPGETLAKCGCILERHWKKKHNFDVRCTIPHHAGLRFKFRRCQEW